MTITNAELTGAPAPLILRNKGKEVEFQATPFSDYDYGAIDRWIQSEIVAIARESLSEAVEEGRLTNEEYETEMSIGVRAALGVSLYEERGASILNTPRGMARLAWQMTREHHPEMKFKDFIPYCRQVENYSEVLRVMSMLNPRDTSVSKDSGEPSTGEPEGN